MIFEELTSINIIPYGTLYGGRLGTFDNPLGYVENYIYERCVMRLNMADISLYGDLFFLLEIRGGGSTLLRMMLDNTKVTMKYIDITDILSANYTSTPLSLLHENQAVFNDFDLELTVYDANHIALAGSRAVLRVVNSFAGATENFLPDELRIFDGFSIPVTFNPSGSYNIRYYGYSGGGVSLPHTTYKLWGEGQVLEVTDTSFSVTEKCRFVHVDECKHVLLYWLSKEAGGWKAAAFEIVAADTEGDDGVEYVRQFGRFEGKRHVGKLSVVYRNASFRTASYISDIVSSDHVLYRYRDNYNKDYKVVVLVNGNVTTRFRGFTNIELSLTRREGEWL